MAETITQTTKNYIVRNDNVVLWKDADGVLWNNCKKATLFPTRDAARNSIKKTVRNRMGEYGPDLSDRWQDAKTYQIILVMP